MTEVSGPHGIELVVLLLGVVLLLAAVARRLVLPYPILLVLGGLGLAAIPGLPGAGLNPDLVFFVFLPPILWSAAYYTSLRDFRRNLRPIMLLAFGLVIATTAAVAMVAHALVPGLGWPAAVALGAIVSPPDAVAAVAVLRRLDIPRRGLVVLEGESLVNDATALVLYRTAVLAMVTGSFDTGQAVGQFFATALGGLVIGLAVGWIAYLTLKTTDDRLSEIATSLLAPYVAWIIAERLGASAVLACVVGGLSSRRTFSRVLAPATRLQARAVWDLLLFALNGVIFILIGLQLRTLLAAVPTEELPTLLGQGLMVSAVCIVVRIVWVPLAAALPRLIPAVRRRDPFPSWQALALLAWAGMRGIVSLAAALALPLTTANGAPLPSRERIIIITFVVILVTLVVQGLTLAPLVRGFHFPHDDTIHRERLAARQRALDAALARLDGIAGAAWARPEQVDAVRRLYEIRARALGEEQAGVPRSSNLSEAAFKRARYATLTAEREELIGMRDTGRISDEVLLELEEELDREAARLGLADLRSTGGGAAA